VMLPRRRALFGLLAAPAIVAAPSLMRVSALVLPAEAVVQTYPGFGELVIATLRNHPSRLAASVAENNLLWAYLRKRSVIDVGGAA
jgi:hypothetical protein